MQVEAEGLSQNAGLLEDAVEAKGLSQDGSNSLELPRGQVEAKGPSEGLSVKALSEDVKGLSAADGAATSLAGGTVLLQILFRKPLQIKKAEDVFRAPEWLHRGGDGVLNMTRKEVEAKTAATKGVRPVPQIQQSPVLH